MYITPQFQSPCYCAILVCLPWGLWDILWTVQIQVVTHCLHFDAEVIFSLVKFWKNQVFFGTRMVQKQAYMYILFVTTRVRTIQM